ncbi:E3 ubiquitin-protein ligase UBR4 isoform X4 [Dermacentor albipictus]|uniref:E3 ubiquitin-protein ligase UBR4 isoform X4 n=1 Tax=Dermacentor albipictus TaxID=60249 RepID=UPI0031FBAEDA
MASASSGPDWFSNAIAILSSSQTSLNKSDLQIIVKSVIQSESVLLVEDEETREFCEAFVALSAHFIGTSATSLSRSQITTAGHACSILLRILLRWLKAHRENSLLQQSLIMVLIGGLCLSNAGTPTKSELTTLSSVLKSAQLPPSLASKPDGTERRRDDTRELRQLWLNPSSSILEQLSTPLLENPLGPKSDASTDLDKDLDLSASHIIDPGMEAKNFLLAKNVASLQRERAGDILLDVCLALPSVVQYTQGLEDVLLSGGTMTLDCLTSSIVLSGSKALFADIALVCKCLGLPVLEPLGEVRLQRLVRLALGCGHMAVAVTQAVCVLGVSSSGGSSQPASGTTKGVPCWDDEGHLALATRVVEACLDIYNIIASTMRSSTRAGGHVLQNLHVLTSWLLLRGLQVILSLNTFLDRGICKEGAGAKSSRGPLDQTPTRTRDQSSGLKQNLLRIQQGFGVLPVALANQVLSLLTSVFGELRLEAGAAPEESDREASRADERILTFLGNINTPFCAWKCVRVLMQLNLPALLFDLVSVSYRKAGMLKRIQKHPTDGDNFSTSDSNTFYEEDFSTSDDSSADEDDDSEPILGHWYELTTAPREHSPGPGPLQPKGLPETETENRGVRCSLADGRPLIPDKEEPHGYIQLSTKVLNFVNAYLVNFEPVQAYLKSGIGTPQMVILAGIIKDLDRETCKSREFTLVTDHQPLLGLLRSDKQMSTMAAALAQHWEIHQGFNRYQLQYAPGRQMLNADALSRLPQRSPESDDDGTIGLLFGASLGQLYEDFSRALARFIHNVLATGLLDDIYQDGLLTHLNINPWIQKEWPLQIYWRTLSVLAQVLLLRQQKDKDDLRSENDTACVLIFRLVLNTMQKAILSSHVDDSEDMNVEHTQLLLFLFHNLQLMQKKVVLLSVAKTIINVAPVSQSPLKDIQIIYIARLLHIFEYLIKNLYDAPASLVDQVQGNLFNIHGSASVNPDAENTKQHGKLFFPCKEVEDNFARNSLSDVVQGSHIRPKFYHLMILESGTQDVPKLDGFACSFLLASPDALNYSDLYGAVLSLLWIGAQCDAVERPSDSPKLSYLGTAAVQYCFGAVWRLLLSLPPSIQLSEALATGNAMLDLPQILHAIVWVSRFGHKNFNVWIKDSLVKQGMTQQRAESTVHQVTTNASQLLFDVRVFKQLASKQLGQGPADLSGPVSRSELPHLMDLFVLEALIAKLQVSLDFSLLKPTNENHSREVKEFSWEIFPILLRLVKLYNTCVRWSLLLQAVDLSPTGRSETSLRAMDVVLRMTSRRCSQVSSTVAAIVSHLPPQVDSTLDFWNAMAVNVCNWRNDFANDSLPSESYIAAVQVAHFSPLSANSTFLINSSLKRILQCIVRFAQDVYSWSAEDKFSNDLLRAMLPLLLDATTESQTDFVMLALEGIIGSSDTEEFAQHVYEEMLANCYELVINYSHKESELNELVFHECLKFMESLLDKQPGKKALEKFFCDKDIWNIFLSAAEGNLSPAYGTRVLKFFSKLFTQIDKNPGDPSLEKLNATLSRMNRLSELDLKSLQNWLSKVVTGSKGANISEDSSPVQENRLLLQNLTTYIVKENNKVSTQVAGSFLTALVEIGTQLLSPASEGIGFSDLMVVMSTLASAGSGCGHLQLFKATTEWLETCKKYLSQKDVLEKLEDNVSSGKHQVIMNSACYLLSYVADLVGSLKLLAERPLIVGRCGAASPLLDGDAQHPEPDSDWADELGPEDDESGGEDSDEDSLCNKLCTFTMTQKEFMNQHWYHCHTCRMVDGVGVCTICAKVCHKDHDVTYAKFGSFFCDCGAKEDGSCHALVKRNPQISSDTGPVCASTTAAFSLPSENVLPSSIRRRASSPAHGPGSGAGSSAADARTPVATSGDSKKATEETLKHRQQLAKKLEAFRGALVEHIVSTNLVGTVLELIQFLMPAIVETYNRNSPIGSSTRAQKALAELHTQEKLFEHIDQLMVPTLGSQEGAFENVRMNFSGEQGQTIRQLLSAHMIRRVAMCCLASPQGKRQHLAVSHEKGKITLLQLSALLKQADSSKRKLTITRLASAPVPFTVLSITGNPCNEDFLAVCGLKDCHVLTFSSSGSVSEHLVLHPQLETGNYIIKAMWLPGSQTELALVTADFVKVYDLSVDALSAQFFFLLPTGRLRDCCFVCPEEGPRHLLLMSSAGYVYCQPLIEESSARHGPFYVTSVLDIQHPDIKDSVGTVAGGGVSIYYSHVLQLLFLSYANGKSFMACMPQITSEITDPVLIQLKPAASSNGGSGGTTTTNTGSGAPTGTTTTTTTSASNATGGSSSTSSKPTPQPLCQWSEVPNHPGLILALMQFSNNPLVLMIKPGTVLVQEIKILTAKSKITDLVAIRHPTSSGEMRTTLILLCEDGSLRIYMASQEQTGYWLTPAFQPATIVGLAGTATSGLPSGTVGGSSAAPRPSRRKKSIRGRVGPSTVPVSFPVDFFEHCTSIQDVEFGGNDLLQIYNAQQVKHRLNTTGMYVACTKPGGLTLEITNTDPTLVMVGVRVLVGSQDVQRAPSTMELFGRSHPLVLTRSRWYDFPFTREESLSADKKISLFFGPSSDPSCVTMVDSVKVYGKSKESFGWPEESDEFVTGVGVAAQSTAVGAAGIDSDGIPSAPLPLTALDRLTSSCLEMLDDCFSVSSLSEEWLTGNAKGTALEVATRLLTLPTPPAVHQQVRALLAALHPSRTAYTSHRDQALLSYVLECLNISSKEKPPFQDLDGEAFYRLVAIARGVACARPANLVQFAESHEVNTGPVEGLEEMNKEEVLEERGLPLKVHIATNTVPPPENGHFLSILTEAFWHLHRQRPQNPALAPISKHGLVHVEATVQALVEVMYAFVALDMENVGLVAKLFARLLLCEDTVVSFAAKQAIVRVLRPKTRKRKVFIPRNAQCSTPGEAATDQTDGGKASTSGATGVSQSLSGTPQPLVSMPGSSSSTLGGLEVQPQASLESQADVESHFEMLENMDAVVLLGGAGGAGGGGAFPPLLDIPPDADDETMVELAIALSLQDQPGQSEDLNLGALGSAGGSQGPSQRASSLEGGHYSDTTASAGASDDEGSTAATDGSTLRTSPAEQCSLPMHRLVVLSLQGGSGAGSESGGSGADSMTGEPNVSGRSSAYGDNALPEGGLARSETSSVGLPPTLPQEDPDTAWGLHALRCALLDRLLRFLPQLRSVGGVRAIPFMQVVLMLSSDLDSEDERDRATLDNLLSSLIGELDRNVARVVERSPSSEEQLIVMRLLSIMMSRIKSSAKASGPSDPTSQNYCSTSAAVALHASGIVDHCLQVLGTLLEHWKAVQNADADSSGGSSSGNTGPPLLKPHPASPPPDMSPFFLRQYVKGHANDVFEAYPQLLTEMALRLPYQVKKVWAVVPPGCVAPSFGSTWYSYLCEYMMVQQTPFIRRQVRKLLLFLCGTKEKYRQLRDLHALESHLAGARTVCGASGTTAPSMGTAALPYDALILVVEHLKACAEVATSRTANWQRYCQHDNTVLPFLFQVSFLLDEGVASIILQLLQCGLCGTASMQQAPQHQQGASKPHAASGSPFKQPHRRERDTSEEPDEVENSDEAQCAALAQQVHSSVERSLLGQFVRAFLLECNSTAVRWQAHSLLHQLHRHSQPSHREALLTLMWELWPHLPSYGRKAAQFVDLLGYFTLKAPQPEREFTEKALAVLHQQNQLLCNHPNSSLYNSIRGLVEMDGYYLESEPCLVCNNPEVAYANIKLSAIKVDSRFTTSTQIVKLVGSHTVSRIVLRIGDLKRSKMVRAINIYYNNRSVQSVVELKNRPAMWHRAKRCSLAAGQTELKMDFPLPIVACNLMIEYADFYENVQASSETLQCPRCSASVPASPGVCANCGENVFQCHKCRAINYDEKDPFLCNSCGFCKYAKFDYTLTAKPCCAVDPIEGEEDRKKAVASINALLEKADKVYRQLMAHKPALELLLLKVQEQGLVDRALEEEAAAAAGTAAGTGSTATTSATPASTGSASGSTSSMVNRSIQQLAQKYCSECKASFDELSKIVQKILASRKELVEYEHKQKDSRKAQAATPTSTAVQPARSELPSPGSFNLPASNKQSSGRCYGCASAAVDHCITLLRALATSVPYRQLLCERGLIGELVEHNLRQGWSQVGQLVCLLTRDNPQATDHLNGLLMERISLALLRGGQAPSLPQQPCLALVPAATTPPTPTEGDNNEAMSTLPPVVVGVPDLPAAVRHEVALLALSLQKEDSCWEQRLRCVMRLFLMGISSQSPIVMESITLPCLKILQAIIKPDPPITKRNKDKSIEELATVRPSGMCVAVDLKGWLDGDPLQTYSAWKSRCLGRPADTLSLGGGKRQRREDVRARFLVEKYGLRWRQLARRGGSSLRLLMFLQPSQQSTQSQPRRPRSLQSNWLRQVLFNPSCRQARTVACTLVKALCQVPSRCREMLDLLTTYLDDLGTAGESGAKFLALYQSLIGPDHWKHYLAIKGLLPHLGDLITSEIEQLTLLEETTLNADLSQGFALKMLTELLSSFIEVDSVRQQYKSRLVGCVLNGYLSLRKLVVQRTKLIDETQEKLLTLLEEMTTGTESETEAFMAVCVATLGRYGLEDLRTPVFIFERLCSLIHPEENELGEFLVTLEKDPQQEDFLQGRMLGNPYSSNEPGMGPLMRDLKNKVCQDCELVALLEDDNGMELLVCNKIMSLDLPVKEVYRKVWCPENGESEAMRVVYRMRGLLGDATEEFVESLEAKAGGPQVDEEQVYRLARVMGTCGGLEAMLERLAAIDDLARGRPLLTVLLKLFGLCVKVRSNRLHLLESSLHAVARLLGALRLLLGAQEAALAEQLLATLEAVLAEGAAHVPPRLPEGVTRDDITFLLAQVGTGRPSPRLLQLLMRVVPFLTLTDEAKMDVLINHFKRQLNFIRFDVEHTPEDDVQLECFCNLSAGIERNDNGNRLKDLLVARGIVEGAIQYLLVYAPPAKSSLLSASENWKEFTSKPALKYVLRILTGLSSGHEKTQVLVSTECIPIIHRLEQVSSDEHVGSLAENLMEALKENPNVAQKIEEVRKQTRDEKKRLAMAMREKQLGELGMHTNEKGQVTAKSSILKQMEDLGEEAGLVCIICREGYKFQPSKLLGIYTFTKRCNLDDFEAKPRKTPGYTTVTHFNIVHVDCHMAAVRHARGRDEWESAALQNANTKCNGLLPLWGPQVPESQFASCLARHNTYIQDCTGHLDVGYMSTLHDLKLLLSRFAFERSFSEDSGGGGPQSNMHLIPYLLHMVLYVINTTRCVAREEKNLSNFLEMSPERQIENCYESEGPCYWTTMALAVWSHNRWRCGRVALVRRMLVLAHARHLSPQGCSALADTVPSEFAVYRPFLCYLAMVDGLYNTMFKRVSCSNDDGWSVALAEYIRHNDQQHLELGDKLLRNFEEQVLTCQSFMEYCDVMGLLCEIPNPDAFLLESLQLRV